MGSEMTAFCLITAGVFVLYGRWLVLSVSLIATVIHGGAELRGWWGKPAWWLFLIAQSSFVALAVGGFVTGYAWCVGVLILFRLADGIGFHLVFHPEWPGHDTLILPLADAGFLFLWMIA